MKVFHLSHIDLDGYGCQLVSSQFFDDITFYNANYGREVMARLNTILDSIKGFASISSDVKSSIRGSGLASLGLLKRAPKVAEQFLILISDLNLTVPEARFLHDSVNELKLSGFEVEVLLLDHHATGEECSRLYPWYHLDCTRCATKIVYEYLSSRFSVIDPSVGKWINPVVEMINSVDIWLEDGFGFEFGKVAMNMIATSNELSRFMFDAEHRKFKLDLLRMSADYLVKPVGGRECVSIDGLVFDEVRFDNELYKAKKLLLNGNPDEETMENILSRVQVELLNGKKEFCKVYYEDKVGFLSYCVGGISVLANRFLNQNTEFDFYMDVSNRGNVSLRANGNCDVSLLSQACFNGGGHKNASGGRIDGFKESFFYSDIKEQVQGRLRVLDEWNL